MAGISSGIRVPAKFEDNFILANGDKGSNILEAFKFDSNCVDNVYSWNADTKTFQFSFQERGTAYGDTTVSEYQVQSKYTPVRPGTVSLTFSPQQKDTWEINFAGSITVSHYNGCQYTILIPGTRTYDPAGMTGDPHASERIGPSCSRTQAAITLAYLVAAQKGVSQRDLEDLQEKLRSLICRYHGRETLFDWMMLQVVETVYLQRNVTPYPEFVKQCIASGKLTLGSSRDHTRAYLTSYNSGKPQLPELYYKKVSQKDPIEKLFTEQELVEFKKLAKI